LTFGRQKCKIEQCSVFEKWSTIRGNKMSYKKAHTKRDEIIKAALRLFSQFGYEKTSVRQIVAEADTSMGNLYFHFPNKQSILEYLCSEFVEGLRKQIKKIHDLGFSPGVGFALDFRIGFLATLEDDTFSKIFSLARNTPTIHNHSLENKRIRLRTFFGDQISKDELELIAVAIQGIADAIFKQKRINKLKTSSDKLSNTIIDYCLRLLGYSAGRIEEIINEVDRYIDENNITSRDFFVFPELIKNGYN